MRLPIWVWLLPLILPIALLLLVPSLARAVGGGFYSQPSTSMEPALPKGSAYITLPISSARLPERGQIAIFEHPRDPGIDYIKRIMALPGDRLAMVDGELVINGAVVPRVRAGTYVTSTSRALPDAECIARDRSYICPVPTWMETLPGGRTLSVLDFGARASDQLAEVTVPEGHVFMLGDNRDNSADSRFSAMGFVPIDNLRSVPWRFFLNVWDPAASLPLFLKSVDDVQ